MIESESKAKSWIHRNNRNRSAIQKMERKGRQVVNFTGKNQNTLQFEYAWGSNCHSGMAGHCAESEPGRDSEISSKTAKISITYRNWNMH